MSDPGRPAGVGVARARRGARDVVPVALVIGDVDLVRPLGLAGVPVAVLAPPGSPARYSRFTVDALPWVDLWDHPEATIQALLRFARRQPTAPVLFYQGDPDLLLVSRYRDRLAAAYRFVVPETRLVEDLVDKARFQALATRLGLPVPWARHVRPAEEAVPTGVGLPFPLVVKPLTRRSESWRPIAGDVKVQQVDSPGDLEGVWSRLAAARLEVLLQQLIPGPESSIESYHVYVDAAGEIVAEFTGRKIRTFPAHHGYSSALTISEAADVTRLGRELVGRLGLRGVAKFDFKRAADGRLFLLEVNPRFTLWHHPGAIAGVNIPDLVYRDLTGLPRPQRMAARPGVRWCIPWHDYAAAQRAGIPLARWVPWMLGCEAIRAFAWDDPLPLVRSAVFRLASRRRAAPLGATA